MSNIVDRIKLACEKQFRDDFSLQVPEDWLVQCKYVYFFYLNLILAKIFQSVKVLNSFWSLIRLV